MVRANRDYFINCDFISLSALRAIFGVWINVCVAIIAICVRSIFRHRIKKILLSGRRKVSLWRISPAVTTSEVFELRRVLLRALIHGHYFFVFASLFCVVVAFTGAASTVISNYSVVTNPVIHDVVVKGQNVTHFHSSSQGAMIEVSSKIEALNLANAPLQELFDFVPNDDAHWIYKANQWNNTWKGDCTFTKHDAVELVLYPTNSSRYQSEVPLLAKYIPSWATVDETRQGTYRAGFYRSNSSINDTGSWTNMLFTYFFGLAPDNDVTYPVKTANISIVNFLAHEIGRNSSTIRFIETAFRSDVYVAECGFVNTVDSVNGTMYQANAAGGSYSSAAQAIAEVSVREVVVNSTYKRPVIQPTGMQMLRYWQAYMSVKDSQFPNPDVRTLAVVQDMVQMRLSSLVLTVGAFLFAVIAACVTKYHGGKHRTHNIQIPSSQLDWIVQAAREHAKTQPETEKTRSRTQSSPNEFAIRNQDNFFIVSTNSDPCIAMDGELLRVELLSSGLQSPCNEEADSEFDPWAGYSETRLFPTSRS